MRRGSDRQGAGQCRLVGRRRRRSGCADRSGGRGVLGAVTGWFLPSLCGLRLQQRPREHPQASNPCGRAVDLVRILVFHGYLLTGTGSDVDNAIWPGPCDGPGTRSTCQPGPPSRAGLLRGRLEVRTLREPVRCIAYRYRLPATGLRP
jgi:hypothetical protein